MGTSKILFTWIVWSLIQIQTATSAEITEEFFVDQSFSQRHVEYWSSMTGHRSYLFDFYEASPLQLQLIDQLKGVDRIRIEARKYPTPENMEYWKTLAAKGAVFIALDTRLPTPEEIKILNEIKFEYVVFVIREFATPEEMKILRELKLPMSMTFFGSRYPDYSEIFSFKEIPMGVPLMFSQDYWLGYSLMDFLNIINSQKDSPHPIRFRVVNATPSDRNFELLFKTMGLDSVIYVTDFDSYVVNSNEVSLKSWSKMVHQNASKKVWEKFGDLPVNWTVKGFLPSAKQLLEFAESEVKKGTRRVTVDLDYPLTPNQKKRLEELSVPVHRIRSAPNP